jgi:hypothetical protein
MAAEQEAKQLDSVTDRYEEKELDASKAQQAISALSTNSANAATVEKVVAVSKEDVALIVSELEVTEEVAERVLREVALQDGVGEDGDSMVVAALRRLVTS